MSVYAGRQRVSRSWVHPNATTFFDNIFGQTEIEVSRKDRINRFFIELGEAQLIQDLVWGNSPIADQNAGQDAISYSLIGPDADVVASPAWTNSGFVLNGTSQYLEFNNPFPGDIDEYTIISVFKSSQSTNRQLIGSDGGAGTRGPTLYAGGSPVQGALLTKLFADNSTNGTDSSGNSTGGGKSLPRTGNTGYVQMGAVYYDGKNMGLYEGVRGSQASQSDGAGRIWNRNAKWRMGARNGGSYFLDGTEIGGFVFKRALTVAEFNTFRRIYKRTLGAGLNWPPYVMIVEGDSISTTNEGNSQAWPDMLQTKSNWAGKTSKGLVSVSGAKFSDVVSQGSEATSFFYEPLAEKYYLFLLLGINDFNTGRTAAAVLTDFITYSTEVRAAAAAANQNLIMVYFLPTQGTSGGATTQKNSFKTSVLASPSTYVGSNGIVVDLETIDSVFANGAGAYYSDGLHWNTTGHNAAAVAVNGLITAP